MRLAIVVAVAACSKAPPPLASCAESLAGIWHTDAGDWMLLDRGATIEGYPLFDDSRGPGGDPALEVAPRAIDLRRDRDELGGEISRRYMRRGDVCVTKVPIHVLSCTGATLEVVLSNTSPPMQFSPCETSSRTNPSRREKWQRVR